ncbi:MAG TPA: transaldolase [Steroidobacteraceae bacterium]|nr:transaldolase [Steroidobacteraceae bacterium]
MSNPLRRIRDLGQRIWLDDIHRGLLTSGTLQRLIQEDGLSGLTSNPSIFRNAVLETSDYAAVLGASDGLPPVQRYEALAIEDLQAAADLLLPEYRASDGHDGFVSMEVAPEYAHDTAATVREGLRLRARLARDNVMIKVPSTDAGVAALEQLIAQGVNVNATLLFSVARYEQIAAAHQRALLGRLDAGLPVRGIASVASFFLSRIDTLVDGRLDKLPAGPAQLAARALRGQTAIALAAEALACWRQRLQGADWGRLRAAGAQPQRLLWASTSTKDPAYPDIKYVEALIAPDTVNTLPMATLQAYRDHGAPAIRLGVGDSAAASEPLAPLAAAGIDLREVSRQLEEDGLRKFAEAYDALLDALGQKPAGKTAAHA